MADVRAGFLHELCARAGAFFAMEMYTQPACGDLVFLLEGVHSIGSLRLDKSRGSHHMHARREIHGLTSRSFISSS
jgi:hypothetical protein